MVNLEIKNLTFTYSGSDKPALQNINLKINFGDFICLMGLSGCGKTTLLRQLKTVLRPHGDLSGEILFNNENLDDIDLEKQASLIGFIQQDPASQIVTDTVWHELAFGLENLDVDPEIMHVRVAEMVNFFGIQDWFHKNTNDLSGGQKQLLNLASVMAMQPSILVLDEPTSQLDPIAAADFLTTLQKINSELGTTVIITEHRLEDIYSASNRIVTMENGHIVCHGSPQEVAQALYETKSVMTYALPSPIRVFYEIESQSDVGHANSANGLSANDASLSVKNHPESASANVLTKRFPLTVRAGRIWLTNRVLADPPAKTYIPETDLPDTKPVIEMQGVWFRYDRSAPDILRGLDLTVPAGKIFAIVGGNGSGKSTTLKCACGILKPYRGKVKCLGKIAMLPQQPADLFSQKTIRADLAEMLVGKKHIETKPKRPQDSENVFTESSLDAQLNEGSQEMHLDPRLEDTRIIEVARMCDIEHLLDAHPFDISGGELERAAIAKILLSNPDIVLLDEPTKGLDNFFKRKLARILSALTANGMTVVLVSHDIEFCARFADVVAIVFDGEISATNTPRKFFSQNSFYTTAANRMSRNVFANAITDEDIVELCLS